MNGPRATICSCEGFSIALPSFFFPSVCLGDVALQDLTLNLLNLGFNEGSVQDLAGQGAQVAVQAGKGPVGGGAFVNFSDTGRPTGGGLTIGPGLLIGGQATFTSTLSLRDFLGSDACQ